MEAEGNSRADRRFWKRFGKLRKLVKEVRPRRLVAGSEAKKLFRYGRWMSPLWIDKLPILTRQRPAEPFAPRQPSMQLCPRCRQPAPLRASRCSKCLAPQSVLGLVAPHASLVLSALAVILSGISAFYAHHLRANDPRIVLSNAQFQEGGLAIELTNNGLGQGRVDVPLLLVLERDDHEGRWSRTEIPIIVPIQQSRIKPGESVQFLARPEQLRFGTIGAPDRRRIRTGPIGWAELRWRGVFGPRLPACELRAHFDSGDSALEPSGADCAGNAELFIASMSRTVREPPGGAPPSVVRPPQADVPDAAQQNMAPSLSR